MAAYANIYIYVFVHACMHACMLPFHFGCAAVARLGPWKKNLTPRAQAWKWSHRSRAERPIVHRSLLAPSVDPIPAHVCLPTFPTISWIAVQTSIDLCWRFCLFQALKYASKRKFAGCCSRAEPNSDVSLVPLAPPNNEQNPKLGSGLLRKKLDMWAKWEKPALNLKDQQEWGASQESKPRNNGCLLTLAQMALLEKTSKLNHRDPAGVTKTGLWRLLKASTDDLAGETRESNHPMDRRNPFRSTLKPLVEGIFPGESSETRVSSVVRNGFRPSTV